ncbi:MAG: methylisocitrate lyase [Chlamydiae bacterium]|nr:methylisocitrate lyase [Chlamydiota bacterium]MBI3276173.1 methylisocitrate lyase [Chlamydiota bacterium]
MTDQKLKLKDLLKKKKTIVLPGVFNAISARMAESVGFEAVYLSGAGLSNGLLGKPDIGLLTLPEVAQQVRYISNCVKTPILVDADTGFGGLRNVTRAVLELEGAGASAMQIEDQNTFKRCGHLPGKTLVDAQEMAQKIQTAVQTRGDKDFLIIARTDARSVLGLEEAIRRAKIYLKAGADVIFPEALESRQEFKEFSSKVEAPLLANMTEFGKTPYISVQEFHKLEYDLVIFPMTAFRVMMRSLEASFVEIKKKGSQKGLLPKMQTRKELYDLINYQI